VEELGVDTAAPDSEAARAVRGELVAREARRAEVHVRGAVHAADQRPDRLLGEAQPVAVHVAREIGVVGGDDRAREGARGRDPHHAEHRRPDRVDRVRPEPGERRGDARVRQRDAHRRVGREGHGRDAHHARLREARHRRVGREDEALVAVRLQTPDGVGETVRDAVDLGEEDFAEESDLHRIEG
jgi:hypothetical protein